MNIFLDYYLTIHDEKGKELKEIPLEVEVYPGSDDPRPNDDEPGIKAITIDGKPCSINQETFLVSLIGKDDIIDKAQSKAFLSNI